MTTPNKIVANRLNALHSTGPRTPHGKAVVGQNAARHGLYAANPVIPRLERAALWHEHRQDTITSLAPIGQVETALAERVALILWRLRRVSLFEQDATHTARERSHDEIVAQRRPFLAVEGIDTIDDTLARLTEARAQFRAIQRFNNGAPDTALSGSHAAAVLNAIAELLGDFDLDSFSAPEIVPDGLAWADIPGWTVERLRRLIDAIAQAADRDPAQLIAAATDAAHDTLNQQRAAHRHFHRQVRDLRAERILPEPAVLDRILRYENHLNRQLNQTLTQIRSLQHARRSSTPTQDTPARSPSISPPNPDALTPAPHPFPHPADAPALPLSITAPWSGGVNLSDGTNPPDPPILPRHTAPDLT